MKFNPPVTIKCSFCTKQYASETCLFYFRYQAEFKPNAPACLCCGDEEEEDGGSSSDVVGEKEGGTAEEKTEREGTEKQKTPSNPGWYGRGCRKRVKKKR